MAGTINSSFSQEWAPIGARWHYTERFAFSDDVDYLMFTSEKDTLFNGIWCNKLLKRHSMFCTDRPPDYEITFSRNDTIYFYDPNFEQFQVLYDFNAQTGDSWIIRTKDTFNPPDIDTIMVVVDSTGIIDINGTDLKKWYVTYHCFYETAYGMTYPSEIIERIGDMTYLFNFYPEFALACDANWSDGLRCYEDPVLGFYSTGIADSCTYVWTGIEDKLTDRDIFTIYPNPAMDFTWLSLPVSEKRFTVSMLDPSGRIILTDTNVKGPLFRLPLLDYSSGLYLLLIEYDNKIHSVKLMIR
jgi:hypothetical protein